MARVTYYEPEEEERYIDDAYFGSLFIKHAEGFRDEKELRAVAHRTNDGGGVNIPVASKVLIESRVLSPALPDSGTAGYQSISHHPRLRWPDRTLFGKVIKNG